MVRETVQLQEQLRKLNPGFDDCPVPCFRRFDEGEYEELPGLCRECEVRPQLEFFESSFKSRAAQAFPDGYEWSFESLSADVVRVQRIDRRLRGKGYPRSCDEQTARCLDILRAEEWRPLRIARWQAEQKGRRGDGEN